MPLLAFVFAGSCSLILEPEPASLPPPVDRPVDFAREIGPLFTARCLKCHGPNAPKGGLSLHAADKALAGGDSGPVIESGQSAESLMVQYVAGLEPDHRMPPKGNGDPLTADQVALLRGWIDQGAKWPQGLVLEAPTQATHWSFVPPKRPAIPEVKETGWVRNPIDAFVLAGLDLAGMSHAPEADRTTLIRRLSLDLIGLPPTVEEVDAFLADDEHDAYERLVERLLASPHYGERWARFWLDRARYADTNGYEKDRERSIWPWRDWVIRAFNADMPFDRFTIEQIASDLLPNPTVDQLVATGFHRNTMVNEEGGIDVGEFRFKAVVDRVATTGTVWLGLTVGCAQCHTHKYDPITHKEFYQLLAYFDDADEPEIELPDARIQARRDKALKKVEALEAVLPDRFPPDDEREYWIAAERATRGVGGIPAKVALWAELSRKAKLGPDGKELSVEVRRARHLAAKRAAWERATLAKAVPWSFAYPSILESRNGASLDVLGDHSVLVSGDKPNNDHTRFEFVTNLPEITAIRLEALTDPSLPDNGPGRAPLFSVGDFILTEIELTEMPPEGYGAIRPVAFDPEGASSDYAEPGKPASKAVDGVPDSGWTVKGGIGRPHAAVFHLKTPLRRREGTGATRLSLTLKQDGIHQMTLGRFRVSVTSAPGPVVASGLTAEAEAAILREPNQRAPAEATLLDRAFLEQTPELVIARKERDAAQAAVPKLTTSMVMHPRPTQHRRTTHIHQRGEYLQPTQPVTPGIPAFLPPLPSDAPNDRLGLARWMVDRGNPLTARVLVNQIWQTYFGRGLVATPEDFGTKGAKPTHPELLDWLACETMDRGWSLKQLHRTIVISATYRQSSRVDAETLARDPKNDRLGRGPRFRVDAEVVRDIALTASGLLSRDVGGPSVYPPQPPGATSLAYGMAAWPTSSGSDRYRRGLYTFIKRAAPYAAFMTFDAPTSEVTCVRRERSNTPLQALTLLNDPVFLDASRALAEAAAKDLGPEASEADRTSRMFRRVLGRLPAQDEVEALESFRVACVERFARSASDASALVGGKPDRADQPQRAARIAVARVLLNLVEAVTKE